MKWFTMTLMSRVLLTCLLFTLIMSTTTEWISKTALAIRVPIPYGNFTFANTSLIVSAISQTVSEGGVVSQNVSSCAVHDRDNLITMSENSDNNTCIGSPTMHNVYNTATWFPFLISFTTLHLNNTLQLPFSLTSPIEAKYLPRVFQTTTSLINPLYPSQPITLIMLLQHTSSFVWINQSLNPVPLPATPNNPWEDYMNVLVTTMGNGIFANCTPGDSLLCYRPSFVNTALLACILTNILALNASSTTTTTTSLTSTSSVAMTFQHKLGKVKLWEDVNLIGESESQEIVLHNWMQDNIFTRLQMSNTSFVISASDANGTMRTTLADGAKLLNATFIGNNNDSHNSITAFASAVGHAMMRNIEPLSQNNTYNNLRFTTNITDGGLLLFNRSSLCAASKLTDPFTYVYCSFLRDNNNSSSTNSTNNNNTTTSTDKDDDKNVILVTYVHDAFEESQLTFICVPNQTFPAVTSNSAIDVNFIDINGSVMQKCVFTTLSITPPLPFSTTTTSSSASPTTSTTTRPSEPLMDSKTGLYVFLGILCILVVVLLGSYFTDYIIQPAPPAKVLLPLGALHAPTSMQRSVIPILPSASSPAMMPFTTSNAIPNNYTDYNDDVFANNVNNAIQHNVEDKVNEASDRQTSLSNTISNTSSRELANKYHDPLATLVVNNNSTINTLPSPFYVREGVRQSPHYGLGTTSFIPPTRSQKKSLHHFGEAHAFNEVTPEDILRSAELTTLQNTPLRLELNSTQRTDSRYSEEEELEQEQYTKKEKVEMEDLNNKKNNNNNARYSAPATSSSSLSSERSLSSSQYSHTSMTTPMQHSSFSHSSLAYRAPSYDNSTRVYPNTAQENVNNTTTTTAATSVNKGKNKAYRSLHLC